MPSWRFLLGAVLFVIALVIGLVVMAYVTAKVPAPDEFSQAQATTVYFSDGTTEIARLADSANREIIDSSQIPQHMKDAIVAAEDRSFYDNSGISPTGLARALWSNVSGGQRQGGSTITQQYAERYYAGTTTTDYVGKFKEAILALKLNQVQDKDTILSNYLNTIYFGRNTYGIQTAAQAYFGVDAADLTVAQAALIAGVVPAPSRWDPRVDPEQAEFRWNYVLDGMVATGTLSQAERDEQEFPETQEIVQSDSLGGPNGYIVAAAKQELLDRSPLTADQLETQGLRIVTTIDKDAQDAAIATVAGLPEDAPENLQTAIVSVEPGDGAIRAMYAGEDYVAVQRNRVTQDVAQAGSTFKPFTLVAALENGVTLDRRLNGNSGRTFEGFDSPVNNFGGRSWGNISLLRATEQSVNTAYVELNLEVTPEASRDVAVRAGIPEDTTDFEAVPSNVLGVAAVHPLDMAAAYATFAAQGIRTDPYLVQSVSQLDGTLVYEGRSAPTRVFEADVMAEATYALTQVVENGSGTTAKELGRPVAGKTGTSNNNRSAWFVGYTPQIATAVALYQVGEDGSQEEITPFGGYSEITGSSMPIRLWTDYMAQALDGLPVEEFPERTLTPVVPEPSPTTPTEEETSEEPEEEPTTEPTPENPTVPSGLVGAAEGAARSALAAAGLDTVVRYENSDDVAEGHVIYAQPGEGAQVPPGSSIVIVVSSGPTPAPEPDPTTPEPDPTTTTTEPPPDGEDGGDGATAP